MKDRLEFVGRLCPIWIVDDNFEFATSLKQIIEASGDYCVTHIFTSAEAMVQSLKGRAPRIILMDIELPGKNGVECTRILKRFWPDVNVVMVTIHEDNDLVFDALKAGASGYITKTADHLRIVSSLNEIMDGGAPMSSSIARMVIQSFHKSLSSPLTTRESQILKLVASGKTFAQISDELSIGRATTKTHVRNVYNKLEVNCRADALSVAATKKLL